MLEVLLGISKAEKRLLSHYVDFIVKEIAGTTLAITDYLTLLQWINTFTIELAKEKDLSERCVSIQSKLFVKQSQPSQLQRQALPTPCLRTILTWSL
ncbi:Uncharacterised protein [Mycobacteroides abscessus subsp. abscessus]|nr:Uncharacterised protein [Mycobacteroides abscessus subsp. abscessus]